MTRRDILLAEVRKVVGEHVPIVVSLDLHGVLTDRMLQHSDAIVAYHTYPHVDFAATGVRAAHLLLKIMPGDVRPVTAMVPIPALVRGNELITETGLFGDIIREAQTIEASQGGSVRRHVYRQPLYGCSRIALEQLCGDRRRCCPRRR